MEWIVLKEESGKITLISKSTVTGMMPKGSFLTIEQSDTKFVLRVDESQQYDPYSPEPLIVDLDLDPLEQDRLSKNIVHAYRIYAKSDRTDGLIDFIKPQSIARRSTQEEIDIALHSQASGAKVFIASVQYNQNQILKDKNDKYITVSLPDDMFFHQTYICGKTGSGKTVAIKYLAQYFAEDYGGAVLAINVKDVDLLKLDKPSTTSNDKVQKEWKDIKGSANGISNYVIYYPANIELNPTKGITKNVTQKISLDVKQLNPDSLSGLLVNITDVAAANLPDIFRHWQQIQIQGQSKDDFTFHSFISYFQKASNDKYLFPVENSRGDISEITLHKGTFDNIRRNLQNASIYFDHPDSTTLKAEDIIQKGKVSVIEVVDSIQFGSIILRDLLHKIVAAKTSQKYDIPILIVIDEVHTFYNANASIEALGDLDTICRTGRSQRIGVIFSSQNPDDIPKGLSSVINTKIFFKSDASLVKNTGNIISGNELESLDKGYALAQIHDMSQIKIIKFPLSYCGVFDK